MATLKKQYDKYSFLTSCFGAHHYVYLQRLWKTQIDLQEILMMRNLQENSKEYPAVIDMDFS